MLEVIDIEQRNRWNDIVLTYKNSDIYYHNEYVKSISSSENIKSVLFNFTGKKSSMCYPMNIYDLYYSERFQGEVNQGEFFDMETPYGYGGPLYDEICTEDLEIFRDDLLNWCKENNVVTQFIRFHPLLDNAVDTKTFFDETRYLHHTISIDTSDEDLIMHNMDTKNRNMVRKAIKNEVKIVFDEQLEAIEEFKKIYIETMNYHNAADMYYFPDSYYDFLRKEYLEHTVLVKAVYESKTVSASLFFYNKDSIHYHLSGTLLEYRNLAAANLLLYSTACWASSKGMKQFHLGGGLTENDSLYGFKKQFNKVGQRDFYIGKTIFNMNKYNYLMNICINKVEGFDPHNNRMIQYRA